MRIRCVAAAYVVVQAGIWHTFYAAQPWRLAGPAIAVCWSAWLVAWTARRRPATWLVGADSAVLVMLAVSGVWWLPQVMRGDTASWLYVLVAAQSVFPLWCGPFALAGPLVLASGAAYWAGTVFLASPLAPNSVPAASTALFFVVATVAWIGYLMLDSRAVRADNALAEADAAEHEHYVALCRSTERREHERLLHDTVLNTLTALARLGKAEDQGAVLGRCRHDVALMEYVLGGARGGVRGGARGDDQGFARDGDQEARQRGPLGPLIAGIEAVAQEMRARGLDVHVRVEAANVGARNVGARNVGGGKVRAVNSAPGPMPPPVPVAAVIAVARAVREALANVIRHAGTAEAWVEISLLEPGAAPTANGGLTGSDGLTGSATPTATDGLIVRVRDSGIGFDPRSVGPDRLGISRSIVERMADCGGTASVRSVPERGTTVTLHLPAAADGFVSTPVPRGPQTPPVGRGAR